MDNMEAVKKIIEMYAKELSRDEVSKKAKEHLKEHKCISPYTWSDLTGTRKTKLKRYRLMLHELLLEIEKSI